ncbi:MAG: ComEA family DNA-binding protein [Bacilli bacterium]|nr:ComEA family DNA-binding protein [Bacilli bacterium]
MHKIYIFIVLLLILTGCDSSSEIIINNPIVDDENNTEIIIEIKGAVKYPGIYSFSKGVMMYEVLNKIGGLLDEADRSRINMIQSFNTNTSINIPFTSGENTSNNLININSASLEELMTLEGIGKAKAQAIIDYRTNNLFSSIEDLLKVSGISEAVYNKIKDNITV